MKFGSDNQTVELLWTIVPTLIVLVLCSLKVKFITAGLNKLSQETIKVVGHQ